MKLKMTQYNGAMALVVSGERQRLIITEEDGCLILELLDVTRNDATLSLAADCTQENRAQEEVQDIAALAPVLEVEDETQEHTTQTAPDDELFKKLALLRKELATADKVPPYLVFHDKTLHEMVEKMPADMLAMRNISGVGHAKLEKYGPVFLAALNAVAV